MENQQLLDALAGRVTLDACSDSACQHTACQLARLITLATAARPLVEALVQIASHSVANLHPEFCVDLPAEALHAAAARLPAYAQHAHVARGDELPAIFEERAQEIFYWRKRRVARGDQGTIGLNTTAQLSPDRPDDVDFRRILINAIRCKKCGSIVQSTATTDLARCPCGAVFAHGGGEYLRRGGGPDAYDELSVWMLGGAPADLRGHFAHAITVAINALADAPKPARKTRSASKTKATKRKK